MNILTRQILFRRPCLFSVYLNKRRRTAKRLFLDSPKYAKTTEGTNFVVKKKQTILLGSLTINSCPSNLEKFFLQRSSNITMVTRYNLFTVNKWIFTTLKKYPV